MDTVLRQDLIEAAIRYTDAYLGVEKHAKKNGFATGQDIHDFSFYLSKAHDALTQLGDIDNHFEYMQNHVADMAKLAGHDDSTLADIPSIHLPKADYGEPAESADVKGDLISEISQKVKSSYLQKAAAQVKELQPHAKKGEYKDIAQNLINKRKRGMAMTGVAEGKKADRYHIVAKDGKPASLGSYADRDSAVKDRDAKYPGAVVQQVGPRGKVKGVVEGTAIRQSFRSFYENLDEAKSKKKNEEPVEKDEIDSDEIESMVKSLSWEDISDLYEEVEIVVEETIEEKLSPAARMKKQRDFRRTGTRRNLARSIKLHRVSSPEQLKNRAIVAARRMLSKKFLQGRDKASLSPQEKDILEQRLQRLRQLGVQSVLTQRLMPRIRQIERTRLKSKSHK